ncbi:MAG: C1 family peptidase [Streptococcus sp.]
MREFDFSYRDKDNQFHTESGLTPQSFYKICRPSIRRLRLHYQCPNYR